MKNLVLLVVLNLLCLYAAASSLKSRDGFLCFHEIFHFVLRLLPSLFLVPQSIETPIMKVVQYFLTALFITINCTFIITQKRSKRYRALKKATHYVPQMPLESPMGFMFTFFNVLIYIFMLVRLVNA